MPDEDSSTIVAVIYDLRVPNARMIAVGGVLIEWIPFLHGWDFGNFQKCHKGEGSARNDKVKHLELGGVEIRIYVDQEQHIQHSSKLGKVLQT